MAKRPYPFGPAIARALLSPISQPAAAPLIRRSRRRFDPWRRSVPVAASTGGSETVTL